MQPKELIPILRHKIITYHCATIFVFQRSLQVLHRQVIKCHCGSSTNWTLQLIALFVQVKSGIVLLYVTIHGNLSTRINTWKRSRYFSLVMLNNVWRGNETSRNLKREQYDRIKFNFAKGNSSRPTASHPPTLHPFPSSPPNDEGLANGRRDLRR